MFRPFALTIEQRRIGRRHLESTWTEEYRRSRAMLRSAVIASGIVAALATAAILWGLHLR